MSGRLSRRTAMKSVGLGSLAMAVGGLAGMPGEANADSHMAPGKYKLPPLPYDYDALEPVVSEQILRIHHDKHHQGYVNGLNSTLEKLEAARNDGDMSHIKPLSKALAYHGSGHVLHTLYWNSMKPGGSAGPRGKLLKAINRDFGSFDKMRMQFVAATKGVEASGWSLLALEPMHNRLIVLQIEKHQNLTMWGVVPLMVCDVWEHAYYLQYENNRGKYVENWCGVVDWPAVGKRYEEAIG